MGHFQQVQPLTRHRPLAAALCGAIFAACVSCGGSPTTPDPVIVDIGGAWTGTWTFMTAGVIVTDTVSVTFNQNRAAATGPWSAATGPGGQLNLVLGTNLSGSASIAQVLITGQSCSASATVTGTATATRVQISLGTLPVAGLCQWGTNQQFDLTRSSP